MSGDVGTRALARLVQLGDPQLQRFELAAPWCVQVDGCDHPGMYLVHRGSARIQVLGSELQLGEGDAVLLPRGGGLHVVGDARGTAPLAATELQAREERRDVSGFRVRGPGPETSLSCVPFLAAPIAWLPRVSVLRRSACDPIERSLLGAYEQALEHGESEVLARVAEALWIRCFSASLPTVDRLDLDVLRVAAAVVEAPATPRTLRSLARMASLSRSRFSARFRESFGEPPMRWVQRTRMEHAERLLREGTMSVAAVAEVLGFNDESAFRKAYRRHRGHPARTGAR